MASFRSPEQIMLQALVNETDILLSQVTPEQHTRFRKIFPLWPEGRIDDAKSALLLVQRTIAKNEKKGE